MRFTFEASLDDGSLLDLKAASILDKYQLPGTFYIVVDWVGKPGYMAWDDIKHLDSAGFNIGSHTVNHPMNLRELFEEDLFYEVQNSKDMIETVLGHNISRFCYPRGRADERVKDQVARAGYAKARTTGKPGVTDDSDPLWLPGTIHMYPRKEYDGKRWLDFGKEVVDRVSESGGYVNLWGHGEELEKFDYWEDLEEFLRYVKTKL